jgi:ribosomal protein S6--L-glutamate ligase
MILSFHPCFVADAQIIPGDRDLNQTDFSLIRAAKAILLPQTCSRSLYRACTRSSAVLFPEYEWRFRYPGKAGQSRFFEKVGCPHPATRRWRNPEALRKRKPPHTVPFFIKANETHEGEGVWPVKDPEDLDRALDRIEQWGTESFITQEMIPCEGNVLRVVVLGKRFCCYWKRSRGKSVTTASRGAKIDRRWRSDLREKGMRQARNLCDSSGINVAAMDFVFSMADCDPEPLILEINYSFGRRGLGGSVNYYRSLYEAVRDWLEEQGMDPTRITLV